MPSIFELTATMKSGAQIVFHATGFTLTRDGRNIGWDDDGVPPHLSKLQKLDMENVVAITARELGAML